MMEKYGIESDSETDSDVEELTKKESRDRVKSTGLYSGNIKTASKSTKCKHPAEYVEVENDTEYCHQCEKYIA